ncbi:MAG: hypothetical protein E6296_01245 [Anaerococcus vaginalis]|nr:hypothetical protein [Anaerococcus vaginalis]
MKIKKILICIMAMASLVACGNKKEEKAEVGSSKAKVEEKDTNKSNEASDKNKDVKVELKEGEEWVVDGQWKLTLNSVKVLEGRNEYEDINPAQVVMVDWSYENLGFDDQEEGLFFNPDGIIDTKGEMGQMYAQVETLNYAQSTPIGAKMSNAQTAFALNNESDKVTVIFSQYVENKNGNIIRYDAKIKANVEK